MLVQVLALRLMQPCSLSRVQLEELVQVQVQVQVVEGRWMEPQMHLQLMALPCARVHAWTAW